MDESEYEDFNEAKARELVYYLLENDVSLFKKLIRKIKSMDSESFENLFKGVPFKGPKYPDGYDYKFKKTDLFERLIDKFNNFNTILEEWYLDEKYQEYIKELWVNYISIENLKSEKKARKMENHY